MDGNHCQNGMSMVVNQPIDLTKSLNVYQSNAKNAPVSQILPSIEGGVFIANFNSTSSSNLTSLTGYTPSTTSMAPKIAPTGGVVWTAAGTTHSIAPGSIYTASGTTYTAATTGVASPSNTIGTVTNGAAIAGRVLHWNLFVGAVVLGAIAV